MGDRQRELGSAPLPCVRCGYLADTSTGPLNFCPKCGLDLRAGVPPEPDPTTSEWLGQVVADRYRLTALLGEGGMGAVFRAEHVRMGKALAVKLLRGTFAQDPEAVERFKAEARIVSRLSHPHTIAVFDFGELPGNEGFYLAMEYVPGRDLAAELRENGKLPEARAVSVAEQLLGSLGEAHEAGIVHRDVKPGNVMLAETGEGVFVKVLDFGIAKLREVGGTAETTRGAIIGTPSYLAPEQARGEEIDSRADLYSVGALLYELLSGRCPFVSRNPMAVLQAHISQEPPPLRSVAPWVSEGLAAAVHRALQKRPELRFQSAAEMRRAILETQAQKVVSGRALPTLGAELASRADFAELETRLRRMRRGRAVAPAALVLGLVAALVAWRGREIRAALEARFPALVALRAPGLGGEEHEPNDTPEQANPIAFPAGPDGSPGTAEVRGRVGQRLDASTGDVDVFRLVVPDRGKRLVLRAEWSGRAPGEGIPGLDVLLTLNREPPAEGGRRQAPLVAQAARGGAGRARALQALVEPGAYYLAVRERHPTGTEPVERPGDAYLLRVHLAEPRPGEEVEPDDAPAGRERRYPEWRALAERNALGEGTRIEGETSPEDPDTYAVAPRDPGEGTGLVLLLPSPGLALTAQVWLPDAVDLAPPAGADRERFEEAGDGAPGEVLALRLEPPPRPGAPALVRLRALSGEGSYQVLALGEGPRSGPPLRERMDALAAGGRGAQALELAAAFARGLPSASGRTEVLVAAGRLAERLAPEVRPAELHDYDRASRRLGVAVFEPSGGGARYGSAFESLVTGDGPVAEEALLQAATRVLPCTPDEVLRRAGAYLARFPASPGADRAGLQAARALEEQWWQGGSRETLRRAVAEYARVARGRGEPAAEAAERAADLSRPRPGRPAVSRLRCQ